MTAGAVVRGRGPARPPGVPVPTGQAVVRVQPLLLLGGEPPVGIHPGRVLDLVLVVGDADVPAVRGRVLQRDEALRGAEQTGLHGHEARLAGRVVDVDLPDAPDLLTIGADHVPAGGGEILHLGPGDSHAVLLARWTGLWD